MATVLIRQGISAAPEALMIACFGMSFAGQC
jgi:hypothetical protein